MGKFQSGIASLHGKGRKPRHGCTSLRRKHAIPQLFHLIHGSQDHRRDLELPGDPQDLLYLPGILGERHHRHRPADLKRGMPAHGLALLEVDVRQLEKRNKFS